MFEIVHTVTDYYDGPRAGIAELEGGPHFYQAVWAVDGDDDDDPNAGTYLLTPIDRETLALALEDGEIWARWVEAFERGEAEIASHPALPADRERHDELQKLLGDRLRIDPANVVRRRAEFRRRAGAPARCLHGARVLEVRWSAPA
ncbi:MAG: hypothetical protein JNM84_22075 [Planctomycetes bacterium]|nr:hypothetical protein [Planctomycetota bacterium]